MPSADFILDVIIIGAGFGGLGALHSLRKAGFNVKCYDRGARLGGVWYWNCYPGARVDSDYNVYQYSDPEIWEDWSWSQRFPARDELVKYFEYVDLKWDLSKDVYLNMECTAAHFNEESHLWTVEFKDGTSSQARWFIPALGFASKDYTPKINGLENFRNAYHTGHWPQNGLDLHGKRVAIIGTGATGVQVISEIGSQVEHLTVYQRTPNLALPMCQADLHPAQQTQMKFDGVYSSTFQYKRHTTGGYAYQFSNRKAFDDTASQRRDFYEKLWAGGGLRFQLGTYSDTLTDQKANNEAYMFWAEKTRARIQDLAKKDLLAPLTPPHAFGTKRPAIERNYYEVFNQDNVDLIDLNDSPIIEVTEKGIRTEKGLVEIDVLILATGFDGMTGGMTSINIVGTNGVPIKEQWAGGVHTYMGMACSTFPNLFMIYGPQAPSASSNGPTIDEIQVEWVTRTLCNMRDKGVTRIEAQRIAEMKWRELCTQAWHNTLFPLTKSWYYGGNIPGKKFEALNWAGGLPRYTKVLNDVQDQDYSGFTLDVGNSKAEIA